MGEAKQAADDDAAAATEYARYLGIEPEEDAEMMWIAKEALTAEVPDGWTECNEDGQTFYFHEAEDRSSWEHPMDAHYKELVKETRRSSLPQEQDSSFGFDGMMDGSAVGMGSPPKAKLRTRAQAATPEPLAMSPEPGKGAALSPPVSQVKDAEEYLSAIKSAEARAWWSERIPKKRVRTRQMAKLLAAFLLQPPPEAADDLAAAAGEPTTAVNSSAARASLPSRRFSNRRRANSLTHRVGLGRGRGADARAVDGEGRRQDLRRRLRALRRGVPAALALHGGGAADGCEASTAQAVARCATTACSHSEGS